MQLKKTMAVVSLSVVLMTGAACSSKTKTSSKTTTTTGGKATTTVASDTGSKDTSKDTSSSTDTSSDSGVTFTGKLKDKLLTASEVPGSFVADGKATDSSNDSGGTDTSSNNNFSCDGKSVKDLGTKFSEEASVSFKPPTGTFPAISENLAHDTQAKVKSVFNLFKDTFSGCTTITMGDSGSNLSGTIAPFKLSDYGDESGAFLMSLKTQGVTVKLAFVIVRKGDLIVNLTYGGLTAPSPSDVDAVVKAAVDKM